MTTTRRYRVAPARLVAVLIAAGIVAHPAVGVAAPGQEDTSETTDQAADDAGRGGELEIDADAFRADGPVLDSTLDSLTANVEGQLTELESARAAMAEAEAAVEDAHAVVEQTEARVADLTEQSDAVVVDAFINPPTEISLDTLTADTPSEATIKQSILNTQATANADVLEDLATAREELEVQRGEEEEQAAAAEEAAMESEAQLADLEAAQSQQALFVAQVQERLDRNLSEADALAASDPELAQSIRDREAEVAGRIQEVREAEAMAEALRALQIAQEQAEAEARAEAERRAAEEAATGDVGGPSGSLSTVGCPSGGSITVDSALAPGLEAMLAAASSDGINLCGGGYRDPQQQIDLRRAHCGTSDYAIYEMPSSQCSPPTARPGTSNHEQGLAVDFTCNGGGTISSQGSQCFQWLDANAADYGFYNLPSEPWHWSNDGT